MMRKSLPLGVKYANLRAKSSSKSIKMMRIFGVGVFLQELMLAKRPRRPFPFLENDSFLRYFAVFIVEKRTPISIKTLKIDHF